MTAANGGFDERSNRGREEQEGTKRLGEGSELLDDSAGVV